VGVRLRLVVLLLSPGVGAVGQCCVVALCCGPAVMSGLHDMGLGVGHCRHLHGVGLAGAVGTGVALPHLGMTAMSGDMACLGPWGQLGRVLCSRTSSRGCCGFVCCVLCVVVPGASHSGLLSWVGVLCDMAAWVGQCKHGGGAQRTHLMVSPWWALPCRL
jgi:hypothetical protein